MEVPSTLSKEEMGILKPLIDEKVETDRLITGRGDEGDWVIAPLQVVDTEKPKQVKTATLVKPKRKGWKKQETVMEVKSMEEIQKEELKKKL